METQYNIEKSLKKAIINSNVERMKNPVIVISPKDLELFRNEIKMMCPSLDLDDNLIFEGIPVIDNKHLDTGAFLIGEFTSLSNDHLHLDAAP